MIENYCIGCEHRKGCVLENNTEFCDNCKNGDDCSIRTVQCKAGYDVECNNGYEYEEESE